MGGDFPVYCFSLTVLSIYIHLCLQVLFSWIPCLVCGV